MVLATSCQKDKVSQQDSLSPDTTMTADSSLDTLLLITMPHDAVTGRLGDETGMSVLQLITDNGDTLFLERTNEETGEDGLILGDIRNYVDTFAVALTPDGESFTQAINLTELHEVISKYKK